MAIIEEITDEGITGEEAVIRDEEIVDSRDGEEENQQLFLTRVVLRRYVLGFGGEETDSQENQEPDATFTFLRLTEPWLCFQILQRFEPWLGFHVLEGVLSNIRRQAAIEQPGNEPIFRFFQSLPDELTVKCLAFLSVLEHPRLSCVSRRFHQLVSSPTLFQTRSSLGITEESVYALINLVCVGSRPTWYVFKGSSFIRAELLPAARYKASTVCDGSMIYVVGGEKVERVSEVLAIDTITQTFQRLPNMTMCRAKAAVGVFGRKLYVIGGFRDISSPNWVEFFDMDTKLWNVVPGQLDRCLDSDSNYDCFAVLRQKIYVVDKLCRDGLCFDPVTTTWETCPTTYRFWTMWRSRPYCVLQDILYVWVSGSVHPLQFFDPETGRWSCVKMALPFFVLHDLPQMPLITGFCGNIFVMVHNQTIEEEIWSFEITLRTRGGETWGLVINPRLAHKSDLQPHLLLCGTVRY